MLYRYLCNRLPGLLVASVPFAGWSIFNVGNAFSFTASYVICVITLILNLPHLVILIQGGRSRHFFEFYSPWILACFFSFLPLIFWDYADFGQYVLSLLHLNFFVIITYCLLQIKDSETALEFYAKAYTLTALFVAIIGLIDFGMILLFGVGFGFEFNTVSRTGPSDTLIGVLPRASSIFFEPGWFAHYLMIDIIVVQLWLLPRAIAAQRWIWAWVLRISVLLMVIAIIATLSASTYVVAGIVVLFAILNQERPLRTLSLIFLALLLLSAIPLPNDSPNPILATFERFGGIATGAPVPGESVDTRSNELAAAFQMLLNTLFLGAGYGQSAYYIRSVSDVGTGGVSSFYGILMAETGVIGLFAFVACIVTLNYKLWRLQKRVAKQDWMRAQIVFCCRCIIFAETLYLNFFSAMASPLYVGSFWLALLLLNASSSNKSERSCLIEIK
jgi:O-antigen ligase